MFASRVTSYITLKDDISVNAFCGHEGDGNILTIDGFLTIYGSDDHLRKIAVTIIDYLNQGEEKESEDNECTTYRQQAG